MAPLPPSSALAPLRPAALRRPSSAASSTRATIRIFSPDCPATTHDPVAALLLTPTSMDSVFTFAAGPADDDLLSVKNNALLRDAYLLPCDAETSLLFDSDFMNTALGDEQFDVYLGAATVAVTAAAPVPATAPAPVPAPAPAAIKRAAAPSVAASSDSKSDDTDAPRPASKRARQGQGRGRRAEPRLTADECYRRRRDVNNKSAQQSRLKRKERERENAARAAALERENVELRARVTTLEAEAALLRARLA